MRNAALMVLAAVALVITALSSVIRATTEASSGVEKMWYGGYGGYGYRGYGRYLDRGYGGYGYGYGRYGGYGYRYWR
jgi:hypothetical protein